MVTVPKLMADGVTGSVAVYTVDDIDPTDREPLDDPLGHLSRVLFHSDLYYPTITTKYTGTLSLPSRGANVGPENPVAHTLFAHGLAGQPLVFGRLMNLSGLNVSLAGSVPVQTSNYGYGRWLTLGADATNVVLSEIFHTHLTAGVSATSVDWEVWVTDLLLDSVTELPEPTDEMLFVSGTEFRAGGGKFDATRRYLRTASSEPVKELDVVQGPSIAVLPLGEVKAFFRYSVAGYVQQPTAQYAGMLGEFPRDPLDFDAVAVAARTE